MEEYMKSELSGTFQVKLVTKNIERRVPGTQFMNMRVKERSGNPNLFSYHTNKYSYK